MTLPGFGALYTPAETCFRLWADPAHEVVLVVEGEERRMPGDVAIREIRWPMIEPGSRYGYLVNGNGPFPDPASRSQPDGVHGLSTVVDPRSFAWTDSNFKAPSCRDLVLYEAHIGAFTPEGTFRAAMDRLPALRDLGITAFEIMPVADFPGQRNWGYDGVSLYAPARCYGTPDDLRRLVDEAHRLGIAVVLDVVYNHLGPDGAYHGLYTPRYRSSKHHTPWGDGMNFDDEGCEQLRAFFIGNALHWVREYHVDGLRLDAVHAIEDESPRHFLVELAEALHAEERSVILIAEDNRNESWLLRPRESGGAGLDAVWADDLHHHLRRRLAGDSDGYFIDYDGKDESVATTIRDGWHYHGQFSEYKGGPRGTSSAGIPRERMVVCNQNHDQVGNRAFGDRLHHKVSFEAWMAASALVLLAPETPLLFMGQEWAASSPFLYFTDHAGELGVAVREGRRKEFSRFTAFQDPALRETIPDPQAPSTFSRSKLQWEERETDVRVKCLDAYRHLLRLRKRHRDEPTVKACTTGGILLTRTALALAVNLGPGPAIVPLPGWCKSAQMAWGLHELRSDAVQLIGPGALVFERDVS